jgi:hypothetical protein
VSYAGEEAGAVLLEMPRRLRTEIHK